MSHSLDSSYLSIVRRDWEDIAQLVFGELMTSISDRQSNGGKTTILISHRPQVIGLADSIVLLEQGQLMLQGTLQELRHQPGQHLDFVDLK